MSYDTIPFSRSIDLLVPISNFLSQMEFSVIALCLNSKSILSQLPQCASLPVFHAEFSPRSKATIDRDLSRDRHMQVQGSIQEIW